MRQARREPSRRASPRLRQARAQQRALALHQSPVVFAFRDAAAEALHHTARQAHRERAWVIAIENLLAAAGEDARLRRRIFVDPGVAIEMILRYVEHGGRCRLEARRRLELKTRQLEDEYVGPSHASLVGDQRV